MTRKDIIAVRRKLRVPEQFQGQRRMSQLRSETLKLDRDRGTWAVSERVEPRKPSD